MKKQRIVSIELLRILAMMMVVMLHYLDKGKLLAPLNLPMKINGYIAWGLESFSIVAVNVYMLISGYFLVESRFKVSRLLQLICQVLFYSLLIPPVLMAVGILQPGQLTIYTLLQYILPTQMIHYWFITAYVTMYLFAPVLALAARTMEKKQLGTTILLLVIFFSVSKSVLPVQLSMDNKGYDGLWFMCVFLIAAYIRLYGIPFLEKGKRAPILYVLLCGCIYLLTMAIRLVFFKTGSLETMVSMAYGYNHILNIGAAVALFYTFKNMNLSPDKGISKLILKIAPYTLGVYLLHEHLEVRMLWPGWLGATPDCGPAVLVLKAVGSVLLVFVIGILVDMVRGFVFGMAEKIFFGKKKEA